MLWLFAGLGTVTAQEPTHTIGRWTGSAYELGQSVRMYGYSDTALHGTFLEEVTLDTLNISDRDDGELFPGTYLRGTFGMYLYATLTVHEPGCYELELGSDDGSRLWLDSKEVIDNDGMHRMRFRKTRLVLEAREYPAELWYYNGFHSYCGLLLNVERLGDAEQCADDAAAAEEGEPIVLSGSALFATGSSTVQLAATTLLDELCDTLAERSLKRLTLTGHTDNIGRSADNLALSRRRAGAVLAYLRACLNLDGVQVEVVGQGERLPIGDNATPAGRSLNRRVEVVVD